MVRRVVVLAGLAAPRPAAVLPDLGPEGADPGQRVRRGRVEQVEGEVGRPSARPRAGSAGGRGGVGPERVGARAAPAASAPPSPRRSSSARRAGTSGSSGSTSFCRRAGAGRASSPASARDHAARTARPRHDVLAADRAARGLARRRPGRRASSKPVAGVSRQTCRRWPGVAHRQRRRLQPAVAGPVARLRGPSARGRGSGTAPRRRRSSSTSSRPQPCCASTQLRWRAMPASSWCRTGSPAAEARCRSRAARRARRSRSNSAIAFADQRDLLRVVELEPEGAGRDRRGQRAERRPASSTTSSPARRAKNAVAAPTMPPPITTRSAERGRSSARRRRGRTSSCRATPLQRQSCQLGRRRAGRPNSVPACAA